MSRNVLELSLTFLELFSGGGMARLGLAAGWRCVLANDICPKKGAAYAETFGSDHLVVGDVAAITASDIPGRPDLIWASSPCTDFSLAGARAGLAGERSGSARHVLRILGELVSAGRAANLVVFENVTGLLTSNGGGDLAELKGALRGLGYVVRVYDLDAASFVPQSRPRIFIVAARLPLEEWPELPPAPVRNTTLADILEPEGAVVWDAPERTAEILSQMSPRHRARSQADGVAAIYRRTRDGAPTWEARVDGLAGCLRTAGGGSSVQSIIVTDGGVSRSRRITPREAARLMGLPDSYRLPANKTAAYSLCGDGVCVPVVRYLAENILTPLARQMLSETERAARQLRGAA